MDGGQRVLQDHGEFCEISGAAGGPRSVPTRPHLYLLYLLSTVQRDTAARRVQRRAETGGAPSALPGAV